MKRIITQRGKVIFREFYILLQRGALNNVQNKKAAATDYTSIRYNGLKKLPLVDDFRNWLLESSEVETVKLLLKTVLSC